MDAARDTLRPVDHWEAEVAYADGTAGALCLVADSGGICSLIMPEGAVAVTLLRFRRDGGAIGWKYRGSGLYPGTSASFY